MAMELGGDGVTTMVLVEDGALLYLDTMGRSSSLPNHPGPEVFMAEVYKSNVEEMCDKYTCYACDSGENARSVIIIDSRCSAHMFSDWKVSATFAPRLGSK